MPNIITVIILGCYPYVTNIKRILVGGIMNKFRPGIDGDDVCENLSMPIRSL